MARRQRRNGPGALPLDSIVSGATGGPATAQGIAYQLDYSVYEALYLIAETLASPYKDHAVTLEARAIHDKSVTRWDLAIDLPGVLTEVKGNATRADIQDWLDRV